MRARLGDQVHRNLDSKAIGHFTEIMELLLNNKIKRNYFMLVGKIHSQLLDYSEPCRYRRKIMI